MTETQPDLSIIIVSYKVWEFLDLTLFSVNKAILDLNCEVIVVDNASGDELVNNVKSKYPFVQVIANTENVGFSKANNIGLKAANGKLSVLLNPDVLVGEDIFKDVINFYAENPEAGGLGLRMINGEGYYLRESKRGLPTPATSFYKIFGLCNWFPHSKRFASYYHGDLDEKQDHQIDILSGAFLVQQRNAQGQFELLDEQYFMYGEDIDLSFQLKNKFGSNFYLGTKTVIHFKGKTTPLNADIYRHFYQAMWLFHKKYFREKTLGLVNLMIWLAINTIKLWKVSVLKFKSKKVHVSHAPARVKVFTQNPEEVSLVQNLYPSSKISYGIEPVYNKVKDEMIVFDLGSIVLSQVIKYIDQSGIGHYAYLSPCGSYLIESSYLNRKGRVIHFK